MTAPVAALPLPLSRALASAAGRAGVSFDFMVRTAARESGFDAAARAPGSSAAGLFQFVEQTWLSMVSRHGAANGLAKEAAAISTDENGKLVVADPKARRHILDLRLDPDVSAKMAGELTRENARILRQHLGRAPQEAELYVAHFLGAGKAAQLINAAAVTPGAQAAKLFPDAAHANRAIFYTPKGGPRTVRTVLAALKSAHEPDHAAPAGAPRLGPEPGVIRSASGLAFGPARAPGGRAFGAPVLRLTPAIIQILSEFSAPAAPDADTGSQRRSISGVQV